MVGFRKWLASTLVPGGPHPPANQTEGQAIEVNAEFTRIRAHSFRSGAEWDHREGKGDLPFDHQFSGCL